MTNPLLNRRLTSFTIRALLLILLVVVAWRSLNYVSSNAPGPDSSIFQAIGWHLTAGEVLYADAWDHKPPLIFALNAIALSLGDDTVNAVRNMERLFAIAGGLAIFSAVYMGFRRFWIAWITSLFYLYHFYWRFVFEDGNVTEEYGATLFVCGVAATIASLKQRNIKSLMLAGVAGFTFSCAILAKEPFLLFSFPWFAYLAWPHLGDWRAARQRALFFICSAMFPALLFFAYLYSYGAWQEWVDSLLFNFSRASSESLGQPSLVKTLLIANSKVFSILLVTKVAAVVGILSILSWSYVHRQNGLPIIITVSAVIALFTTSLGGTYSGHYFLFFIPSYILLVASGLSFVEHYASNIHRALLGALVMLVLLALLALDTSRLQGYVDRLAQPWGSRSSHPLAELVLEYTEESDRIWAPWQPLLYADTRRKSPTKWVYVLDHLFRDTLDGTSEEKFEALRRDLRQRPPRLIVLSIPPGRGYTRATANRFLQRSALIDWIDRHYRTVKGTRTSDVEILMLKD
jgi:hypothetical protein